MTCIIREGHAARSIGIVLFEKLFGSVAMGREKQPILSRFTVIVGMVIHPIWPRIRRLGTDEVE